MYAGEGENDPVTLVKIHLLTGRHHQIRVQMAAAGCPIWENAKYNEKAVKWKA